MTTMVFQQFKNLKQGYIGVPIFLMGMLAMVTLPIPPFLLDLFFSFNIALSLVVLMATIYSLRPLDFAVFPTILLITTLMRLALNVASTRVVLLNGHTSGDAAGKVIQAFGEVVIGGNYAVGLVVFAILVIINFVVITKGAGRVSEVSARFVLDAMPGKQMAIDADLNAGLIKQDEAKARRSEIAAEADFYGAMDGASKFVRGDAVAGILILFINLLGGLAIGILQHHLAFADATKRYALLTIGDGLVAQIPSLLLSTAAAIMVTRVNSSEEMSTQIIRQMFENPKSLLIAATMLGAMGVIPGMPHVAFLGLAIICGSGVYFIKKYGIGKSAKQTSLSHKNNVLLTRQTNNHLNNTPQTSEAHLQHTADSMKELGWDDVQSVDILGLEVGYRLITLVDKTQGGKLLQRIKGVRKKLSQELGFLMPTVHIRDNLDLLPNAYRITLMGVPLAESEIYPEKELAINPGQVLGTIEGIIGKDPAFGMEAIWIDLEQKDQAQSLGYTVVDASTVIATHMNKIMHQYAHEILGHDEVQKLIDQLQKTAPHLVESLTPQPLPLSVLLKVLQNLLQESIPIRDMRTIAEALAEAGVKSQDPDALTAWVRIALARMIAQTIVGNQPEIPVITLNPDLEQLLLSSVMQARQNGGSDKDAILEPGLAERLQKYASEAVKKQERMGQSPVILVASGIRSLLSKFLRYNMPNLYVLAYNEIPANKKVTVVSTLAAD